MIIHIVLKKNNMDSNLFGSPIPNKNTYLLIENVSITFIIGYRYEYNLCNVLHHHLYHVLIYIINVLPEGVTYYYLQENLATDKFCAFISFVVINSAGNRSALVENGKHFVIKFIDMIKEFVEMY